MLVRILLSDEIRVAIMDAFDTLNVKLAACCWNTALEVHVWRLISFSAGTLSSSFKVIQLFM